MSSTPPDQAAQELRRKINLTVMGNYPGTTASDQFIDDLLALMYRETLAFIDDQQFRRAYYDQDTPEHKARGLVVSVRDLRQTAALRYGQTEPEKQS